LQFLITNRKAQLRPSQRNAACLLLLAMMSPSAKPQTCTATFPKETTTLSVQATGLAAQFLAPYTVANQVQVTVSEPSGKVSTFDSGIANAPPTTEFDCCYLGEFFYLWSQTRQSQSG
jgi:hypothetical protein